MKTQWTLLQLQEAIKTSTSYPEVFSKLGYSENPGNTTRKTIARYVREMGLDTSHIRLWASLEGQTTRKISLEELLVENCDYKGSTSTIKKRLISSGVLKNECYICGLQPHWKGKPLMLQLDHINGKRNDNRRENLRILCPNCHTQTDTFTGRNKVGARNQPVCRCGKTIGYRSQICRGCSGKSRQTRNWPEDSVLFEEVTQHGLDFIAKKYNVIKKALKARLDRRKFDYSTCPF